MLLLVIIFNCGIIIYMGMKIKYIITFFTLLIFIQSKNIDELFILVEGGDYTSDNNIIKAEYNSVFINDFYISKYEVSQAEWIDVMGSNPSICKGLDYPVHNINWYDAIEYCNKRSLKEGLTPCYIIDKKSRVPDNKNIQDYYKWTVNCNFNADGYRLPTAAEWEFAAKGGIYSKGYKYSGSNTPDKVASITYIRMYSYMLLGNTVIERVDSHNKIGLLKPNELGIYDMSGNMPEWCWDMQKSNGVFYRILKGGNFDNRFNTCEINYVFKEKPHVKYKVRSSHERSGDEEYYYYYGFRLARSVVDKNKIANENNLQYFLTY